MRELYLGYDVMAKRDTLSWNDKTRQVIDARMRVEAQAPRFFESAAYQTLQALCDCICPQEPQRVPLAALVDEKMAVNRADGFRLASMPEMREAWRRGLAGLEEAAARTRHLAFNECQREFRSHLVACMAKGALDTPAWQGMSSRDFFETRVLPDIVKSYYSHPAAWSEIGFGGPASPRGYVRMDFGQRDPWEAAEAQPGAEARALQENRNVGR